MTSKHPRRHPLKRVRPDNENQGSISSSNGRSNKKFCRQSSEDSAFIELEKSSDERAFDLFYKEYFSQFRPFFKHRSIVVQFLEHLWSNTIETSKVSFIKKILKQQRICDTSTTSFNDNDTFSNDENDSQINNSLNISNNKYTRTFINDLLFYMKHIITPRFIDKNLPSKMIAPLRRSSRIRRAPIKCVCSTCIATEEHLSSTNEADHKIFQELIDHYHQLDDQYDDDSQIEMTLSEVTERTTSVTSSPPIIPMASVGSNDIPLPSFDFLLNPPSIPNEKLPLVISDTLSTEPPARRTYVILTELDEPFFGPYPIEFTITI